MVSWVYKSSFVGLNETIYSQSHLAVQGAYTYMKHRHSCVFTVPSATALPSLSWRWLARLSIWLRCLPSKDMGRSGNSSSVTSGRRVSPYLAMAASAATEAGSVPAADDRPGSNFSCCSCKLSSSPCSSVPPCSISTSILAPGIEATPSLNLHDMDAAADCRLVAGVFLNCSKAFVSSLEAIVFRLSLLEPRLNIFAIVWWVPLRSQVAICGASLYSKFQVICGGIWQSLCSYRQ